MRLLLRTRTPASRLLSASSWVALVSAEGAVGGDAERRTQRLARSLGVIEDPPAERGRAAQVGDRGVDLAENEPPRTWAARGVAGPIRPTATITVEPLDDGRCRATFGLDFDGRGIAATDAILEHVRKTAGRAAKLRLERLVGLRKDASRPRRRLHFGLLRECRRDGGALLLRRLRRDLELHDGTG